MSSIVWENRAVLSNKLYDFQIKAIENSLRYLKSNSEEQALIKMPTGTGKTFVIGVLACFIRGYKNVLIVSPSAVVRDHLYTAIKKELWEKMNVNVDIKKSIDKLFPSNLKELLEKESPKVFVTTIQSLTQSKGEESFADLLNNIDLVLFDEGHKEPAPSWSGAIRLFSAKTILFTATPIRNDYQVFNIDENFFYNFSLNEAIDREVIRNVKFECIDQKRFNLERRIKNFIDKIIEIRKKILREKSFSLKVIIRFGNFEDLNLALQYLAEKNVNAIAIHDRFNNTEDDNSKFQNVPKEHEAIFWLAQHKLVEGVDESKFAILGIFAPFDNARSLIQQIGRILRRDKINNLNEGIVVINSDEGFQKDMWNTYLEYENHSTQKTILPTVNLKSNFKKFLSNQPEYTYGEKKFLKKFNEEKEIAFEELDGKYKLPLKVNILSKKNSMSFDSEELLEKIIKQKELSNEIILNKHSKNKNDNRKESMNLVIYSKYKNSPILNQESFIEIKLGLFFLFVHGDLLFYYDTNNYLPDSILGIASPISNDKLQLLFNEKTEFTEVALKSGVITQNNIHRQIINSRDMKKTAPNMTDKYNFCTTITGNIEDEEDKSRRYIGFANSRVSDNSGEVLFKDYRDWVKKLAELITKGTEGGNGFFERYAPIIEAPDNTNPILITFNLDELEEFIVDEDGNQVKIITLDYEVIDSKFTFKTNVGELNIKINFENQKYKLNIIEESSTSKLIFKSEIQRDDYKIKKSEGLISYLNRYQDFHIVTQDIKHIYHKKEFYRCEIEANDNRLTEIFEEYQLIDGKRIESEKGKDLTISSDEWSEESLFYLISSLGKNLKDENELKKALKKMNYLICTDLGPEIADFVGLDTEANDIYFIHCKAKESSLSGSAFQDICSQIIKNLDYAHPLSKRVPRDSHKWKENWKIKNVERNRVIKGEGEVKEDIWEKIKEHQQKPDATTHIWALTANMFSSKAYREQKDKESTPRPEVIHIDYLLMNAWSATQSVGAKFKFFFDEK